MSEALDLDADEAMLREAVERALADSDARAALCAQDAAASEAAIARHWRLAREMGWPGLLIQEVDGGQGMRVSDLAILAEAMGRHLFCGPFLATAVLAPSLGRLPGAEAWARATLGPIARGEMAIALAWLPARDAAAAPIIDDEAPPRISGQRELVEHPALATHLLVLDIAEHADRVELRAALVANRGAGLRRTDRQAFDITCPVAHFALERAAIVDGTLLRASLPREAADALLRPLHVAVAAELVGLGRTALERAVAHAKTREQFGQKIGAFQAIKHRLADAFVALESARLAVRQAAFDERDPLAAPIARALATEAALRACGDYVQVLGGLGFSWESDAHLHLKRARRLAVLLADPAAMRQRIAELFIARTRDAA